MMIDDDFFFGEPIFVNIEFITLVLVLHFAILMMYQKMTFSWGRTTQEVKEVPETKLLGMTCSTSSSNVVKTG